MDGLPRRVTISTSLSPAAAASSTTSWMTGVSMTGSISLGVAFVAGRNRVPSPATGMTAFVTEVLSAMLRTLTTNREDFVQGMLPGEPGANHDLPGLEAGKSALRRKLRAARRELTEAERADAGRKLRDEILSLPEIQMAGAVAAYCSVGTEPGTRGLLFALW